MPSEASCVDSGGVETVIVSRRKIDNDIVEHISSFIYRFDQRINTWMVLFYFINTTSSILVSVISNHSDHKLV